MEDLIGVIRERIAIFREHHIENLDASKTTLIAMSKVIDQLHNSSSRSCWGNYADLYYQDFKEPPKIPRFRDMWRSTCEFPLMEPQWQHKSNQDIDLYLSEKTGGYSLKSIIKKINEAMREMQQIKGFVETDFLPLRLEPDYDEERKKFKAFSESHGWNWSRKKRIQMEMQNYYQLVVDPTEPDIKVPPHIEYKVSILYNHLRLKNIFDYIDELEKYIRKIEVISKSTNPFAGGATISEIIRICDRFSLVAHQLQKRYDNRDSFIINDEYDVQDLLKALLKISFEDVRREEPTPSKVGKSSRIDILLKREKIAIETKMPRKGLNAKKIEEECLIDCGRYTSHPDCGTLIFFVYDPRQQIDNPRGLEGDLMELSNESLCVIAIIRS